MTVTERLRLIAAEIARALAEDPPDLTAIDTNRRRIEAAAEWIEEGLEE